MLVFEESGREIKIMKSMKLSISTATDILNVFIDENPYKLIDSDLKFNSTDILNDQLLIGNFTLCDSIVLTVEDSFLLQNIYLDWESQQLQRSYITFNNPSSKADTNGGVASYHPYFTAIVNKISRYKNFDLKGFGKYLSDTEMKFVHQYSAFHPELNKFVKLRDALPSTNRNLLPCGMFDLVVCNALAHVECYRDRVRFDTLYEARNFKTNDSNFTEYFDLNSCKLMMDYDHVLDSPSIWSEKLDFLNSQSSGGFLDLLNLPF